MSKLISDEEINLCGIKNIITKEDAQFIAKAQRDSSDREWIEWLRKHCKGKHRGFGHYGISDSELKEE